MPVDTLVPLDLPPGIFKTGTIYQAKGRWGDGNLIRFFQQTKGPIGGWVERTITGDPILGIPRAAISYRLNALQQQVLVVGTTEGLYAIVDDVCYDITPAAMVKVTSGRWHLDTFGAYLLALNVHDNASFNKNLFIWEGDTGTPAYNAGPDLAPVDSSSNSSFSVVATADRFAVMLGGFQPGVVFDPVTSPPYDRLVFWASQESVSDWVDSDENTAGSFPLATEGTLQCAKRVRGGTLILTTTDAWLMRYIGGLLVHGFEQVGDNCGSLSGHGLVALDTTAFWMGKNGFFLYDGFVKPIECDVHDHVFGDINLDNPYQIWAFVNPLFGEITWHYPSAESVECDKYVTYSYREGHWSIGSLSRTCGVSHESLGDTPVLLTADAEIFDHETGSEMDGETPYLESGPVELGNGDNTVSVQRVVPDDKTVGDVELTVLGAMDPDSAEISYGPYPMTAQTWVRIKARQFRIRFTQTVETAWRVGMVRFGIVKSSRR